MKHRKREQRNLSCDQLRHLAGELSTLLQDNPWERELWCDFKHDVVGLAQPLVGSEGQDNEASLSFYYPCARVVK